MSDSTSATPVAGLIPTMLALIFATGCAVSHPAASTVQSWPSPPPAGYSMLMLYWTQAHWGQAGGGPSVYIDDVAAFKSHINHYTWIYVRSGQHTFRTVWGYKIFGWNPVSDLNMNKAISLEDGKSYYLRLRNWVSDLNMNVIYTSEKINVAIDHVSERTARKEAGTCWFTKPFIEQVDGALKGPEKH